MSNIFNSIKQNVQRDCFHNNKLIYLLDITILLFYCVNLVCGQMFILNSNNY